MLLHLTSRSHQATQSVGTFEMFTLYKMIFYIKFLSHTVKFGQNGNKIDNIKIIINLLPELKSKLRTYPKRKQSSKTATLRKNKQKIQRRKSVPKVPPPRELCAIRISSLIINSVQRMRSTTCLHPRSPLRKTGVERVKIRPPKGIRNDQLASYNFY